MRKEAKQLLDEVTKRVEETIKQRYNKIAMKRQKQAQKIGGQMKGFLKKR